MPILKKISFYQYKNYLQQSFAFTKPIVCIYGQNGCGKTNILDAIYYLGYTKSYFGKKDALMVSHNQQGMYIEGLFEQQNNEDLQAKIIIRPTGKKELYQNQEEVKQLSKHIGLLPCIMVAPDDMYIINEGSEYRRKLMDSILGQTHPLYLQQLLQYQKVLEQRNGLLKNWEAIGNTGTTLLELYNTNLAQLGSAIHIARLQWIQDFAPMVAENYNVISESNYAISINVQTSVTTTNYIEQLNNYWHKDIASKRTNFGVHKDDLIFTFNTHFSFKEVGSQGQKKSLLFALKIAQFYYIKKVLGRTPILLLDDVFEKLDSQRSKALLQMITNNNGQTFITDTHLARLQEAFVGLEAKVEYVALQ